MTTQNTEMDDWELDQQGYRYVNRWDKSLKIAVRDVALLVEPLPNRRAEAINQALNQMAARIYARRRKRNAPKDY